MKDFPDVLGLKLTDAVSVLEKDEIPYRIIETVSLKREPLQGDARVIRQTIQDEILLLTICKVPG